MRKPDEVHGAVRRHARWARQAMLPVLLLTLALGTACRGNNTNEEAPEPVPPTFLSVRNQAFLDMNIYVFRSSQRMRLGTATGGNTTKFTLPPSLLFGTTPLRFQAVPIGNSNRAAITQEISVTPGDEVELMIPPN